MMPGRSKFSDRQRVLILASALRGVREMAAVQAEASYSKAWSDCVQCIDDTLSEIVPNEPFLFSK